ncbi:ACOX1 [Bugula neritina]|uniref:ACOX1 n=1 Tax=Bugula neritina TaxID=10212 RepID=A0A7J7JZ06_BUGNE|nr:ACOX1 [Bugula neritina]
MPTNTDIAAERANSNINARDLTFTLYGEDGAYRRKLAFERADKDQAFEKSKKFSLMDRDKLYDEAIRMETVVAQRLQEYGYNNSKDIQTFLDRGYFLSAVFLGVHPFAIHFGGFIPSILGQGTPEQIQEFLPKAECMEYIGTYCQTELSHGSFVRGLETTATYDKSTEEFILHTPNLSAIKFWPGGLGRSCNYAVLMAQLVITGKNYGIHPFMCQLRDLNTHQPLPGVEVGDINYKFGGNALDNGYLILTHYRIPRTHLLMKYAQVSPDGTYTRQDVPPQIAYLSMTFLRTILVTASASSLAKAATIATRYSAVRRQTANRDGIEPQILDYQTQQMKLFPAICTAYALHFSGAALQSAYNDILASVGNGDMSRLSELHCLTSGLKAYSDISSHHIEVCRRSCGGHGYSHASGIPDIYQQNVINCTVEGESTVLYLQVGRSLVKFLKKADSGEKLPPALAFLSESSPPQQSLP